jgi:sodium/hydrogen antiporter
MPHQVFVVLTAVAALGLLVAALSARLRLLPVSEPLLALVTGVVLGPELVGVVDLAPLTRDHALVHEMSLVLLAVSVMAIALRYPIRDVRRRSRDLGLLLLVVMPLMAVTTAGLAWWVLSPPVSAALLLGAALCPTDPVLASSVVTGEPAEKVLPSRTRQLLSLESGANDGLALPLVVVALAVATPLGAGEATAEIAREVVGAVVLGAAAGWLAARAVRAGEEHGATSPAPVVVFTLVLALGVLGAAKWVGVSGVIAVFVAGLSFNAGSTGHERAGAVPVDEAVNRFLVLPVFVVLGAVLPWSDWRSLGWAGPALVVALLLLRRLPWLLALARPLRLPVPEATFLGWFGPIGVSAMYYLTDIATRTDVEPRLLAAGTLVVAASTVVHGLTSTPGRRLYDAATEDDRLVAARRRGGG